MKWMTAVLCLFTTTVGARAGTYNSVFTFSFTCDDRVIERLQQRSHEAPIAVVQQLRHESTCRAVSGRVVPATQWRGRASFDIQRLTSATEGPRTQFLVRVHVPVKAMLCGRRVCEKEL